MVEHCTTVHGLRNEDTYAVNCTCGWSFPGTFENPLDAARAADHHKDEGRKDKGRG